MDTTRLARAVREILYAVGENPERAGLRQTPERVARAYAELFAGLMEDPLIHLSQTFQHESEDLISVDGIQFTSLCEHHLLPVFGVAYVSYLPSRKRVVGLSKIARTVQVFARRPQLQERMTAQIADAIMVHLKRQGVVVVVEAEHMCLRMRGAKQSGAVMRTLASRGVFQRDLLRRQEVLALMGMLDRRETKRMSRKSNGGE